MPVVDLKEVAEYVSREATRRNGKVIPTLPKVVRDMTTKPHFYVFNVGPWSWSRQLGGRGTREVQGCPEGKKFSDPLELPALDNETVAMDMNKMENRQEDGMEVVNAFLMKGYGFTPKDSLENWGVAVIDHWPPVADDLVLPTMKLNEKLDELIAEADRFHENREYGSITDYHRWAARKRKQQKGWLNTSPELAACPACGSDVKQNIARCPQCSAVLNEELDRKYFPEKYAKKAS